MSEQKQVRTMEVVPYNSKWKDEFETESKRIRDIMGDEIIQMHHIGSTSIPGISAKPVIDVLVEVKNIEIVDRYNSNMEELGYIAVGEAGIEGRRFFLKGLYNRTHHVHIFQTGSSEIKRHINFRDYMIAHPEDAEKYSKLKEELSIKFRHDSEGYCAGKDSFIKEMDRRAEEWKK